MAFASFSNGPSMDWSVYRDLRCPPTNLHSLDPACVADLHSCLDDGMLFAKVSSGTAIPIGSKLLEARRIPMTQRHDLHTVVLLGKRSGCALQTPQRPSANCRIAVLLSSSFGSGGSQLLASCVLWKLHVVRLSWRLQTPWDKDLAFSGLTLSDNASDDISCYECLAQIALLHCACAVTSSGRLCVRVPSWTVNTGAESVANRLFTFKSPLCMLLNALRFSVALLQWNWTPRTFLAREMHCPAGTARTHCRMV